MAIDKDALRDWHRLFGLVLTDFFTGSPFIVEIESDLSTQQQFLDVLILRRGDAQFDGRLPDDLAADPLERSLRWQGRQFADAVFETRRHFTGEAGAP